MTLLRRRMNCSASPISPSRNVSTRGRWSTTVTFVPSRPNIDAYSTPMTPAPTTVMLRGRRCWMCSSPSESMIVWSSNSTSFGRAGLVPVAMTMLSAVTSLTPSSSSRMQTVCSSTKDGLAEQQADAVAAELLAHHLRLGADDARRAVHQELDRLALAALRVERVGHVERAPRELVEHRDAQRLGGDRAGVDRDAAEPLAALDDGDALAELGGLDGRLLAARAGADDEEVQVHGASLTPRSPSRLGRPRQRAVEDAASRRAPGACAAASGTPAPGRKPARNAARPSARAASRSSDLVCEAMTASRSRAVPSGTSGGSTAPT